jgi:flavin reductase (DIM6/NTAB) family NADH-FMN oxidoreductase RutF|tara:strand:- start:1703 stop:2338 length:636 start_codon:yes stop_codon:yes gene_type:complete
MYFSNEDIKNLPRIKRLNLINSITGVKPANLIGTRSNVNSNLAIISSIVHLSTNPPLLSFMLRPDHKVRRHTYENIKSEGFFTINNITDNFIEQAHYTSAKFDREVSEFKECNFTEEYLSDFTSPFVKESSLKLGMSYVESVFIKSSNTVMVVGKIEHIYISEHAINKDGLVDLEVLKTVGISGLNSYYKLKKLADFPYARVEDVPDFLSK